jgi:hypothetical protein
MTITNLGVIRAKIAKRQGIGRGMRDGAMRDAGYVTRDLGDLQH